MYALTLKAVKMKLTVNPHLTNDPATCKRLETWNSKKVQFQKDLKTILREQSHADLEQQVRTHVELTMADIVKFATQWSDYTRKRQPRVYGTLTEPDQRYAIRAVQRFLYKEGELNSPFIYIGRTWDNASKSF